MVWNEEKNRGLVKLSRETACARSALVEHRGIELNFSDYLTCRDMGNSPYLRRFLALTCFIILSFIVSF